MDEDRSNKPEVDADQPELEAKIIEKGVCPICGYELKGQSVPGICPECGNIFASQAELPTRAKPSAFKICLLYGWPLVFFFLSFGLLINSSDPYAPAVWMMACLLIFVVSAINGGIMTVWLLKRHQPQDRSQLGFTARMKFVGGITVFMFYMMVVIPLVIGGGCTLVIFGLAS